MSQEAKRQSRRAYLYHSTLCDHSQLCVRGTIGVFLHPEDAEAECALQLWVSYMSLLHTKSCKVLMSLAETLESQQKQSGQPIVACMI